MKTKNNIQKIILLNLLVFSILLLPSPALLAQVMQSTTYQIGSDSLNFSGDDSSSSTNYSIGDTLGEIGTGSLSSTNYALEAGFWGTAESTYITISSPSDLTLSSVMARGVSTQGTVAWTVTTNNSAGYSMTLKSSTNPTLKSISDSFADYTPANSNPDYYFNVAQNSANFAFSPEGTDTYSRFKDNGAECNAGSSETSERCWDGITTSDKTIASRSNSNHPSGIITTVRLRAAIGANYTISTGNYSANLIATVTTL